MKCSYLENWIWKTHLLKKLFTLPVLESYFLLKSTNLTVCHFNFFFLFPVSIYSFFFSFFFSFTLLVFIVILYLNPDVVSIGIEIKKSLWLQFNGPKNNRIIASNTVISSNFLVQKFCGDPQILWSFWANQHQEIKWNYCIFHSGCHLLFNNLAGQPLPCWWWYLLRFYQNCKRNHWMFFFVHFTPHSVSSASANIFSILFPCGICDM